MNITVISISALTARTGNWAICTSSTTASPVTTSDIPPNGTGFAPAGGGTRVSSIRLRRVDVDAFVLTHRGTWDRLDQLIKRRRSLTGAEVDELVELYQRVSTHLSMLRSASRSVGFAAGRPAVEPDRARPRRGDRSARPAEQCVHPLLDGVLPGGRLPRVAVVAGDGRRVLRRRGGDRFLGGRQSGGAVRPRNTK